MSAQRPDVRPGQVWADNDPRSVGRTLRVDRLLNDAKGEYAVCTVLTNTKFVTNRLAQVAAAPDRWAPVQDRRGRQTSVRLTRFRPISTGYRLVTDVQEEDQT